MTYRLNLKKSCGGAFENPLGLILKITHLEKCYTAVFSEAPETFGKLTISKKAKRLLLP